MEDQRNKEQDHSLRLSAVERKAHSCSLRSGTYSRIHHDDLHRRYHALYWSDNIYGLQPSVIFDRRIHFQSLNVVPSGSFGRAYVQRLHDHFILQEIQARGRHHRIFPDVLPVPLPEQRLHTSGICQSRADSTSFRADICSYRRYLDDIRDAHRMESHAGQHLRTSGIRKRSREFNHNRDL